MSGQWITLAVAALTFLTAVIGVWSTRQNRKKIAEVHVLVDGRMTTVLGRVAQLENTLVTADVEVPPDVTEPPPGVGTGAQ
jgi:hypothetical protein